MTPSTSVRDLRAEAALDLGDRGRRSPRARRAAARPRSSSRRAEGRRGFGDASGWLTYGSPELAGLPGVSTRRRNRRPGGRDRGRSAAGTSRPARGGDRPGGWLAFSAYSDLKYTTDPGTHRFHRSPGVRSAHCRSGEHAGEPKRDQHATLACEVLEWLERPRVHDCQVVELIPGFVPSTSTIDFRSFATSASPRPASCWPTASARDTTAARARASCSR